MQEKREQFSHGHSFRFCSVAGDRTKANPPPATEAKSTNGGSVVVYTSLVMRSEAPQQNNNNNNDSDDDDNNSYNQGGAAVATDDEELNAFLFSLGCYSGEAVTVVSRLKGGCVVSIKDGRYNIDNRLAETIRV